MKRFFWIVLLLVGVSLFVFNRRELSQKAHKDARYTIGILQTASHPALDAVREGFVEAIQQGLGDDVTFIVQNAQGSVAQAHSLAQQFHAQRKLDGVLAIATPAAQAMSAMEKERPIFIGAVTDPAALGLVYKGSNVCGTRDLINVGAEIEMMVVLVPEAKTVGLLYTSAETNSLALVKQMHEELEKRGLQATDFTVTGESDVQAVTELACRKVDVLLAPTDNTIASAITLVSSVAQKYKKPLIVSDNMLVAAGPLAARGIDYRASGVQTGNIAVELLQSGRKAADFPIEQAESSEIFINKKTAALLNIQIPDGLQVTLVGEEK